MKRLIFLLAVGLAISCVTAGAAQAYIVDTGSPPDDLNNAYGLQLVNSPGGIGFAGEFTISQPVVITSMAWWLAIRTEGELAATIRQAAGDLPGDLLFSQTFTAPQSMFVDEFNVTYPPWSIWAGPEGLNWSLAPGTYWAGLELNPGSALTGLVPNPSINPLGNEAFSTDLTVGYNIPVDNLDIGVRIAGVAAAPLPGTVLLLGSGVLALAAWRSRRLSR